MATCWWVVPSCTLTPLTRGPNTLLRSRAPSQPVHLRKVIVWEEAIRIRGRVVRVQQKPAAAVRRRHHSRPQWQHQRVGRSREISAGAAVGGASPARRGCAGGGIETR
eukprot:scaffold19857_cov112-Isochrysis_galbana.AAC.2